MPLEFSLGLPGREIPAERTPSDAVRESSCFGVKTKPFDQAFAAALSRNSPPVLPFGNSPQVPPNDLGELSKSHLERNPACPDSLNERLRRAARMERRHVVMTTRQNPVFQPDAPLNNPRTNSQHCPGLVWLRAFGPPRNPGHPLR